MVFLPTLMVLLLFLSGINGLPNIVIMLTDDLGWNSAWNNNETLTPTLDSMLDTSLVLESFYTYKYCAPTRGSFLTGRFPYKLCATRNNLNPPSIPEGINLGYTYIPKKLSQAGYISYQIGKWHQGLFSPDYTPVGRGFNYSFGFLSGGEDHYNQHNFWGCTDNKRKVAAVDLYNSSQPAIGLNGTYNAFQFTSQAVKYIENHSKMYSEQPLFLYFALHNTHAPVEAPDSYINMYNFNQTKRNTFDAMVSVVDDSVKNITNVLKENNLWSNTLFIWTTDNGAPVSVAGSNYPFRGSKGNNFEGGVHVPALISGGILPSNMYGKKLDGLVHISDFYATFCYLAGINPTDTNPNSPSEIDSINMWSYFNGSIDNSPRSIIVHDHLMYTSITQGAIRSDNYKLIVKNESQASWYGQFSPNQTWNNDMEHIYACSVDNPCLFDIVNDPTEHNDLSKTYPNITEKLLNLFYSYDNQYHPAKNAPSPDESGYCNAIYSHQGFSVPWIFNETTTKN